MTAIHVNDIWQRNEPVGDDYDRVRVVGVVGFNGERQDEYSIQPADSFGATLQTDKSGLVDFCTLIESGDPESDWTSDVS